MSSIGVSGRACLSSRTRKLDSSAWPVNASSDEREEGQRHEREQREVRDHRGEVRAAVGEELLDEPPFSPAHRRGSIVQRRDCRAGARRPDRDLVAGRGGRALRREGRRGRVDARRPGEPFVRAVQDLLAAAGEARRGLAEPARGGDGRRAASSSSATARRASPRRPARSRRSALVFYDLKTRPALRRPAEAKKPARRARRRRSRTAPMRKLLALGLLVAGWVVGIALLRRTAGAAPRARRPLLRGRLDAVALRGRARGRAPAPARARRARSRPRRMNDDELRGCAPRARVPRGRLRPPLGPPLALLPRQVPLRDAARPAPAARRAARGGDRASTRPTRS